MKTVAWYENDDKNDLFLLDDFRQKEVIMFLSELVKEFLFDCKIRALSELTIRNYEK